MEEILLVEGQKYPSESLSPNELTEIRIMKLLKENKSLLLSTKRYQVGASKMFRGPVTIDSSSQVKVMENSIQAVVYFPFEHHPSLINVENTEVVSISGCRMIKAVAEIKKRDLISVQSFVTPY